MSQATNEAALVSIILAAFKRQYKIDLSELDLSTAWRPDELYDLPVILVGGMFNGKQVGVYSIIKIDSHTNISKFHIMQQDENLTAYIGNITIDIKQFPDLETLLETITSEATKLINTPIEHLNPPLAISRKGRTQDRPQILLPYFHDENEVEESILINQIDTYFDDLIINFTTILNHPIDLNVMIQVKLKDRDLDQNSWVLSTRIKNCTSFDARILTIKNFDINTITFIKISSVSGHISSNILSNNAE